MSRIDTFIVNIYRAGQFPGMTGFREAALHSLGVLVPFDGALWGSGNLDDKTFHSVVTLGVHADYPRALEHSSQINPMLPALLSHLGQAVDLADVVPDDKLDASEIYRRCFAPYGVERIVSRLDMDARSRIYTLISLYRFDRAQPFIEAERATFEQAAYHMVNAAQNAFFMHLAHEAGADPEVAAAICDSHGLFYEAQPQFLNLLERHFEGWAGEALPFAMPSPGEAMQVNGLCVTAEPYTDLFCLRLWAQRPADVLPELDREIVDRISKGMTFKEIGRELGLAASTVSNRTYGIYRTLGVSSRTELAQLVHGRKRDGDR